jgi:hypothetical protein
MKQKIKNNATALKQNRPFCRVVGGRRPAVVFALLGNNGLGLLGARTGLSSEESRLRDRGRKRPEDSERTLMALFFLAVTRGLRGVLFAGTLALRGVASFFALFALADADLPADFLTATSFVSFSSGSDFERLMAISLLLYHKKNIYLQKNNKIMLIKIG